jgi:hypothetical protein
MYVDLQFLPHSKHSHSLLQRADNFNAAYRIDQISVCTHDTDGHLLNNMVHIFTTKLYEVKNIKSSRKNC